jgi:hypothetical protein
VSLEEEEEEEDDDDAFFSKIRWRFQGHGVKRERFLYVLLLSNNIKVRKCMLREKNKKNR